MDIENFKKIELGKNTKTIKRGLVWKTEADRQNSTFKKFKDNNTNYGILTGSINKITAIDLDAHKWDENHIFYKMFGGTLEDITKYFNTYTQKTISGGLHLIFKYDVDFKTARNRYNTQIDIRNDGAYIVGSGTIINGVSYSVINDTEIKEIPSELKEWFKLNYYKEKEKKDKPANKLKPLKSDFNDPPFSYDITDDQIKQILDNLPSIWFYDFNHWFKLTTFLKILDKYDLWDTYSKKYGKEKYTNNNNNYWEQANPEYDHSAEILKGAKCEFSDFKNYFKYKQCPNNTIKATNIINRRKLSKNFKDDKDSGYVVINPNTNYIIKSDTGTGKTTLMKVYLKNNPHLNFISIVSRITLANEQHDEFNKFGVPCCHYNLTPTIYEGINLITTIDSIMRCSKLVKDIENYVIFIDEINSVIEYILQADKCLGNKRGIVFKFLIQLLTTCKHFIGVDADISDLVFLLTDYINRPIEYIENKFKHNGGVNTTEVGTYEELVALIKKENKYIVCCDSATIAKDIWNLLEDTDAVCITGETVEINNLDTYDKIIYSPKIIYGLDSTMNRPVFICMMEHTISPRNMIQQATRCRDIKHLYYYFDKKEFKQPKYQDWDICQTLRQRDKAYADLNFNPFDPCSLQLEELFFNMETLYLYRNDCYNSNKFIHFRLLLRKRGFIVKLDFLTKGRVDLKKKSAELQEERFKNFKCDDPRVQELNQYLEFTDNQLCQFKEVLCNTKLLTAFFKLLKYEKYKNSDLKKEDLEDYEELMTKSTFNKLELNNKKDFKIKKVEDITNKIRLLEQFKERGEYTESDNGEININKSNINYTDLISDYKTVFKPKGQITVDSPYTCEKIIYSMLKQIICDKENTIFKTPLRGKNGKDKKPTYKYSFDKEAKLYIYLKKYREFRSINYEAKKRDDVNNLPCQFEF